MRAWAWLVLVLSALFAVGLGSWTWISSVGELEQRYAITLQGCYTRSEMQREELRAGDAQYDQLIANISREYYECTERVKAIFDRQMDELRSRLRSSMEINAGVFAAIWLLVWAGARIGPRLVAGLREQRS